MTPPTPTPTPNREVLAAWVAALRSGRYRQGWGGLRGLDAAGPRYCCLGVLCELAVDAGVVEWRGNLYGWRDEDDEDDESFYGAYLPGRVVGWAGLPSADPPLDGRRASHVNDVERLSFAAIADLIERTYLA